ncbi:flagellin [Persephonella sp.]|uniref:flagellin N-terminal helical domain-containing protein n=1 Tax=Persephonella sp. TaxID=2060922 RepID=UPI0025EA32A6|nr:flagellin [Persephonella sp.]
MALRINYNFQSEFTHVNILKTERNLNTSLERLATGYRINSAKDDAAGLFIADQLNLVARALEQGSRNAQDGISAAQIAEASLSQIYTKLTDIYTKAEQAATDTNDATARLALQRDIQKLVDAIDRISNSAEFNGIKLLDGTFTNKVIHYGARADQTLSISIDSARAKDLGAYVINGTGTTTNGADTVANVISGTDFEFATTETISIAGRTLTPTANEITDAKRIADWINGDNVLQELGIEATAKNQSVADATWTNIAVGSDDSVDIKFYVGPETTADFTISYGGGETITLNDLVQKINSQASANGLNLTAKAENNKLVLETDGETVAVEITLTAGATTGNTTDINLGQFIKGGTGQTLTDAATGTASGVKVGDLTVLGPDTYSYDLTGVSGALGVTTATGSATLNNLNSLDVRTNANAELAMKVIDIAIKKVDTLRSTLGSIQINLQALIDNNDFSSVQTREAESRIRNVDFAKEMSNFTKQQTLMQSGMAMLAQANQLPQLVLQLLR